MTRPCEFRAKDWQDYKMVYAEPHRELETAQSEIRVVDKALTALMRAGILPTTTYDMQRFDAFRRAVRQEFDIPWTAITPRLQRLIYAVNAIIRPKVMLAAGVFCGNTFICNAGAGVGPGACYDPLDLVGIEIKPEEAARAERNVRKLDGTGAARIVAADAVEFVACYPGEIELLYLDASAEGDKGKRIYLDILSACHAKLKRGAIVLAHNSVNNAERLKGYLDFVRNTHNFQASMNMIIDGEGLEVSLR